MNKKAFILFNRYFKNDDYEMMYNSSTGFEVLRGINGKEDPFSLELPSLLDIGVMGTCIHKCSFCYQGHDNKPNMSLDNFKSIIDQTKYHIHQVALGGRGDPNKHENFKEIVEYCRKNDIVPSYTTSGINLTDDEIEISKMCGAVAVSDYRQDYTYRAIKKLQEAGIKTNIHIIFSKQSYSHCLKILEGNNPWVYYIKNTIQKRNINIPKINAIIFLLFKPQGSGKNLHDMIPEDWQLKKFSEMIFNNKAKCKVGMDSCLVNHTVNHVTLNESQMMSIDTCEGARMSAYISPDMKFMPCSFADHNKWGIGIKNNLKDVWDNSSQFKTFRDILKQKRNCCPLGL